MKVLASFIVEFAPIFLVVWWWPEQRGRSSSRIALNCIGTAFVASGICSYIGAKYFGLTVFGRLSTITGEHAAGASVFLITIGIALLLLHYFIRAASLFVHRVLHAQHKTPNQSFQPTAGRSDE
jgi:hypothetical protein